MEGISVTGSTEIRPIYTIGHSNLPLDVFCEALSSHHIEMIIDVRTRPHSRFPRFNRTALERSLAEIGIGYRFLGDTLGGRPSDPSCYRGGVVPERREDVPKLVDYDRIVERTWYQEGVAELRSLARHSTVAIMCSEGDPLRCHRHHLLARTLSKSIPVRHIVVDRAGIAAAHLAPQDFAAQPLL